MRAIEAVKKHYESIADGYVDVPEWIADGAPLRVHFKRLTPQSASSVKHILEDGGDDVDVLARLALDAEGKKLFGIEDKPVLRTAAAAGVVSRVVAAMLVVPSLEEAAKN